MHKLISRGAQAGDFEVGDIATTACSALALMEGFIRQVASGTEVDLTTANNLTHRMLGTGQIQLD